MTNRGFDVEGFDISETRFEEKGIFAGLLFRYAYKRSPKLKKEFYTKKPGKKYTDGIDVAYTNELDIVQEMLFAAPTMELETFKKNMLAWFVKQGWPVPVSEQELSVNDNLEPMHPYLSYNPNDELMDSMIELMEERAKNPDKFYKRSKPLIDLTYDPSRRPFLFMLAFGIFIVLAVVFVIFDMMKQ